MAERRSDIARAYAIGGELIAAIVGGAVLGWLIDRWQGTAPWGVLGGTVVGIVGGGYNFVRNVTTLNRSMAERYRRDHQPDTGPGRERPQGGEWFERAAADDGSDGDPDLELPPDHDRW